MRMEQPSFKKPEKPEVKTSAFSRFLDVEPEKEQELLDEFEYRLGNLKKDIYELEHPSQLDEIYEQLAPYFEEFLRRYGMQVTAFPKEAITLPDLKKLSPEQKIALEKKVEKGTVAAFFPKQQRFLMFTGYDSERMLEFFQHLSHEMFHGAQFASVEMDFYEDAIIQLFNNKTGEELGFSPRREGLQIFSKERNLIYFHDLHEALTEEMAVRFGNEYFGKIPELSFQYHERESYRKKWAASLPPETSRIGKEISSLRFENGNPVKSNGVAFFSGYVQERERLDQLVVDLYEKNKQSFKSKEDVFRLFVDANFKGRLLPLARLIENTYGKGSFRKLGEETAQTYYEES
jgi:hypothetical protein